MKESQFLLATITCSLRGALPLVALLALTASASSCRCSREPAAPAAGKPKPSAAQKDIVAELKQKLRKQVDALSKESREQRQKGIALYQKDPAYAKVFGKQCTPERATLLTELARASTSDFSTGEISRAEIDRVRGKVLEQYKLVDILRFIFAVRQVAGFPDDVVDNYVSFAKDCGLWSQPRPPEQGRPALSFYDITPMLVLLFPDVPQFWEALIAARERGVSSWGQGGRPFNHPQIMVRSRALERLAELAPESKVLKVARATTPKAEATGPALLPHEKRVSLGEPFRAGSLEYRVMRTLAAAKLGKDAAEVKAAPGSRLVIVRVEVTNQGKGPAPLPPTGIHLVDRAGHTYPPSARGYRALASDPGEQTITSKKTVAAGETERASQVFELPEQALREGVKLVAPGPLESAALVLFFQL